MKNPPKTFEEGLARLEKLTREMQSPEQPLEEALKNYEEGRELIRFCQEKVTAAQQKLEILDAEHLTELKLDQS